MKRENWKEVLKKYFTKRKYYLYIDESGDFEKSKQAFVGAILSHKKPLFYRKKFNKVCKDFKEHKLGLNDIHIQKLRHPIDYPITR